MQNNPDINKEKTSLKAVHMDAAGTCTLKTAETPHIGKTVLITGASTGIGAATARLFAAKGCDLILTGNSHHKELDSVRQTAVSLGRSCRAYSVNFADSASIDRFLDRLDSDGADFDLLINNAGISRVGLIQDTSSMDWNALLDVNVTAVYRMCRYAVKKFLARRASPDCPQIFDRTSDSDSCPGKILNISSVWGVCGASCEAAYSATKGAVNSFTKALAKELAPSHIPVNAIAFGAVDTSMNDHLSEEDLRILLEEIPAGRMATPEEAARIIWQMAGFGDYVTGQILVADGGWT